MRILVVASSLEVRKFSCSNAGRMILCTRHVLMRQKAIVLHPTRAEEMARLIGAAGNHAPKRAEVMINNKEMVS